MSDSSTIPPVHQWVTGRLPRDVEAAIQRMRKFPDVRHVAIMPDVHLAGDVCIGSVLGTRSLIYPAAVGGDIGCGIAAIAVDCEVARVRQERVARCILQALRLEVPIHRHARPMELPHALSEASLSCPQLERLKRRDARIQFATLGRGNHFLEFQEDAEGRLWVMVHSGSRAVGQAIRDYHVAVAGQGQRGMVAMDAGLSDSDVVSTSGRPYPPAAGYLADVAWAQTYAGASRLAMLDAVAGLLSDLLNVNQIDDTLVTCDHNHVRKETHHGEELWVHRKGAASARLGEPGIIPGSMGTASYLVEGRGHPESLQSSSHGAGRAMSRGDARQRISTKDLLKQLRGVRFNKTDVASLREEAPAAYKSIEKVMRAQRDLVRIVRILKPVLSYKGN